VEDESRNRGKLSKMKMILVGGARPNFIKIAALVEAITAAQRGGRAVESRLVHTGQHYDDNMSGRFFSELGLSPPDIDLAIGPGTHGEQTAKVIVAFEKQLMAQPPDVVVVVGDVNSTMASALAARKLNIPVAHVEAGLRSRDRTMPEEVNRIVTDVLCDFLFTTDQIASANLRHEGIAESRIHFVGNVMIDTLMRHHRKARELRFRERFALEQNRYAVLTLHRPENVDRREIMLRIFAALREMSRDLPIIFPIHPRTRKKAEEFQLLEQLQSEKGIVLVEPLGYLELLSLTGDARMILTDSGGVQEEALILGVPCITLRENTERPITVEAGGNRLVGTMPGAIMSTFSQVLAANRRNFLRPEKWDGHSAKRILNVLLGSEFRK
jgi:UDP-N-acetylglucosamine 2-epimerase (non-hydrolysing)